MAALVIALAITACANSSQTQVQTDSPTTNNSTSPEAAQQFTLPTGLNGEVSLASYAGKQNIVLVFYRGFW